MAFLKFTRKELRQKQKAQIARPDDVKIPIDDGYEYQNEYYFNISRFFRLFEYIFIAAAVIFTVGFVASHPQTVSYNNFLMFVKDFNMSAIDTRRYTELTYDTDYTDRISLYRDGAVIPGSDSLFVFSATGRLAYTSAHTYSSPMLATGEESFVLYDFAEKSFSVYNSYFRIFSGESDSPIYSCSVADNGSYAFTVKKKDGGNSVYIYSDENIRVASFDSDNLIISSSLSPDGSRVAVSTLSVRDGKLYAELKVYSCSDGEKLFETKYQDEQPLLCGFFESNEAYLLTNGNIFFYSADFELEKKIKQNSADYLEADEERLLILSGKQISLFSSSGELIFEKQSQSAPLSLSLKEDALFVLLPGKIIKTNIKTNLETEKETENTFTKILATSEKHITAFSVSGGMLVEIN